jgi:para-aminobenzoate synthetase component 1
MGSGHVLAALPRQDAATIVRDGATTVVAFGAQESLGAPDEPFAALDRLANGWWAGVASYELGHRVEHVTPRAGAGCGAKSVPALALVRFAARAELRTDGVVLHGRGAARRALERALDAPAAAPGARAVGHPWSSDLDRSEFERRVRAVQDLVRAGECYQVNLTRRLHGPALDPVALWCAVDAGNPAPHGGFWRDAIAGPAAAPTVVSASPERFLRVDGDALETRPIKGTARDVSVLRNSAKDRAENVMIVDLARNDLGRVCVPGSVRVPDLCRVERHPGLVHLVSTVRGTRRADVGWGALLRATFPPASITGAPKPRVMQAIEDLEPEPRGVYCGAFGWIDADADRADLAVAIRTFACTPTTTTFGVGAGITIDSEPEAEWAETELKAARLLALAGAPAHRSAPVGAGRA